MPASMDKSDRGIIRNGTEKDLDDFFELYWISSLEHAQYNEKLDALKSKEQCKEYIVNRQRDFLKGKDEFFFVAEDNNKIIGMITGHVAKRDEAEIYVIERVGYIDELCVSPEYRNSGIGKKLMEKLLEELFKKDVEFVGLGAAYKNVAINFYKSCGFIPESVWMVREKNHKETKSDESKSS